MAATRQVLAPVVARMPCQEQAKNFPFKTLKLTKQRDEWENLEPRTWAKVNESSGLRKLNRQPRFTMSGSQLASSIVEPEISVEAGYPMSNLQRTGAP